MKRRIPAICFLLFAQVMTGFSQDAGEKWLRENACALQADTVAATADLDFLSTELKNNTVIGLGEATHGTKEFFNQKRRIIEYLILKLGYTRLGFEFSESFIHPINQYVLDGTGDLKSMMSGMMLYNAEEIYRLFEFIKHYNSRQPATSKVKIFGFDREEYAADPLTRDKFMAKNIVDEQAASQARIMLWAHNVHMAKDLEMGEFKTAGYYMQQQFGEKYYALGTDTYSGSVHVIGENGFEENSFEADKGSFTAAFATAKKENLFIPFRKTPNPFSGVKNNITNVYSNWTNKITLPIVPGVDFDAILFINKTTPSKLQGPAK